MTSTQMRDAIAKALDMNPTDIKIVSCKIGINDTDDMTCQEIYDSFSDRAPKDVVNTANRVILEPKATDQAIPAPGTWAQSQADKNLTRVVGAADEIEALHHKVLHLEVENKELTRRNDRQAATINELHEKIADGEELADKKARRKSLVQSILLAQALMGDIFDEHDALVDDETLPMDVLNTINTELDLIFQRIHNLGEYVTRIQ